MIQIYILCMWTEKALTRLCVLQACLSLDCSTVGLLLKSGTKVIKLFSCSSQLSTIYHAHKC